MTEVRPSRDDFRALARDHTVVPLWRDVLADLTTPVAAFARVVGGDEGFLLESVEGGDRWSRWSFIGRRPQATIVAREGRLSVTGDLGIEIPTDRGMLSALDVLLDHYRAPDLDGLPPLHGGLVGYLGYDVVREVEHLPDTPPDDLGYPDAVISMIGELAVYDHWLQRVSLICNVFVPPDADHATLDAAYDGAVSRIGDLAAAGARATDGPLMEPPGPDDELPEVTSTMGEELYSRATSSRSCWPSGSTSSSTPTPSTSTGPCAR